MVRYAHIFSNGTVHHLEGAEFPLPFRDGELEHGVWMVRSYPTKTNADPIYREICESIVASAITKAEQQEIAVVFKRDINGDVVIATRDEEMDVRGRRLLPEKSP